MVKHALCPKCGTEIDYTEEWWPKGIRIRAECLKCGWEETVRSLKFDEIIPVVRKGVK